jgi:sterol desaturase/sphingolipid hydroxylase (fatty acid hydroxylase superfamily)
MEQAVDQMETIMNALDGVSLKLLFVAIFVELLILWLLGKWKAKKESWVSVACFGLGMLPYYAFFAVVQYELMLWLYDHGRLITLGNEWYVWVLAFICFDLAWWLVHFAAHKVRFLWCIHGAHHTPTDMNLSVAIRGSIFDFFQYVHLVIWLPLLGFHPFMVISVEIMARLYGVFTHLHKDAVPSTPALDQVLITPSLHRVHHAKNPRYIDTNYANMFAFWDKLFGTHQLEVKGDEPVYGVTDEGVKAKSIVSSQFSLWKSLLADMKSTPKWIDRIKYVFMPPGWHPQRPQPSMTVCSTG